MKMRSYTSWDIDFCFWTHAHLNEKIFAKNGSFAKFLAVLKIRWFSGHNELSYATIHVYYQIWIYSMKEPCFLVKSVVFLVVFRKTGRMLASFHVRPNSPNVDNQKLRDQ